MAIQKTGSAPYAPASTVIDLIERYRNHGLTIPFTTEVLTRAGVTDSLAARTLQALKLLDLVKEDGMPSDEFAALQEAPSDEYRSQLAEVIHAAYADVFAFTDPSSDSPERVEDAFRGYQPKGQRPRMVTLFLALCAYVGIIEEAPKRAASQKQPARNTVKRPATRTAASSRPTRTGGVEAAPGTSLSSAIPPAIVALVNDLATRGQGWTALQRQAFLDGFRALVDMYFPASSDVESPQPALEAGSRGNGEPSPQN